MKKKIEINEAKDYLKNLNKNEYESFCKEITAFHFLLKTQQLRYDYDTIEAFQKYFFVTIMTNNLFSPLYQSLWTYSRLIKEKNPNKRWIHISEWEFETYLEYKKCKYLTDSKNPWKEFYKFYNKHFKGLTKKLNEN